MLKIATVAGLLAVALAADNPYATYPSVPKTATINGLADPIYDRLPECAKSCFSQSTSSTPCPYWDTGCLCVMTPWTNSVAQCIADQCKGNDVTVATSVAAAQCASAGVWEPYFIMGGSYSTLLDSAAAQTEAETTSSEDAPTSATSSEIEATTSSEEEAESSSPAITSSPAVSSDEAEEITTTSYARTASINGFADPIYDKLPSCAQPCVMQSTSSLPCPYWDTGCLCVIQMFSFKVAECIADSCVGEDVNVATSLAFSVCKAGGVHTSPEWNINASLQEALEAAAAATGAVETTSSAPVIVPIPTVGPMPSFATSSSSSSQVIVPIPTVAPVASESSIVPVPSVAPASSFPENPVASSAETSSAEESAEPSAVASESAEASAVASESAIESAVESAAESASESAAASSASSAAVSASAAANSTEVVSQTHSEIVTITSCDEDKCTEIESTATATSKTTEIVTITSCDEDKCVVTTVCPESESTASVAGPVTKTRTDYDLVTITSCKDQKCTESVSTKAPKTVTVYEDEECVTVTECIEDKCKTFELSTSQVTKTVEAVETVVVTTYSKPIEVETMKSVSGTETIDVTITKTMDVPVETKPVETKPVETKPVETKPVETKPAEDSAKPTSVAPVQSTPAATSAAPTVSSFEGAAAVNTAGLGFAALLMALPFF